MSEQTANLCTTDACESLRARLAKYEDAEGRPLRAVVMPEPLKRGDEGGSGEYGAAMIRGYNACLREVARLNSSPVSAGDREALLYLMDRFDNEVWVCPRCSHEEPTNDMESASYLREYLAGAQNASAGGVDERAAITPAYETCNGKRCGWCSEGAKPCLFTQQERDVRDSMRKARALTASAPIATCLRGQFETWAMETDHPVFGYIGSDWLDHGDNPNTYANDYIQGAWVMFQRSAALADHLRQALRDLREALDPDDWMGEISMHSFIDAALALSAPSHGEQVREGFDPEPFIATIHMIREAYAEAIAVAYAPGSEAFRDAKENAQKLEQNLAKLIRIAAAPSAGSQGGDV